MMVIELLLVCILAYLIGSVNMSIIISKAIGKGDIREQGSKNAGTTNTLRVLGKGPALLVFIWDVLKGVIAVGIARGLAYICNFDEQTFNFAYTYGIMLATFAVVLGHSFPVYFGFKGGKGVATSLGCILAIEPQIGLVCLAAGLAMIVFFNMVSIGSIIAAIIYPICVFFQGGSFDTTFSANTTIRAIYIAFAVVMAILVLFRHKSNIERIRNGTENRLFKSKKEKFEEAKNFDDEPKKEEVKEEKKEEVKEEPKEEKKEEVKKEPKEENKDEEIDIKFEPKKEIKEDEKSKKKKNK